MSEEIESDDCMNCLGKGEFAVYKLTKPGSETKRAVFTRTDEIIKCRICKGTGKKENFNNNLGE